MTASRPVSAAVALAVVAGAIQALDYSTHPVAWRSAYDTLAALSYALALPLCWKIAADFGRRSWMRLAWRLMAASAAVAILRHVVEVVVCLTGWLYQRHPTVSLRQFPIVASLVLLSAALALMWMSFHLAGLHARWHIADAVLALLLAPLVYGIFAHRASLADANSVWPMVRLMQSASPFLLATPALLAVPLHRIAKNMGGGLLARSLRSLVVFLVVRLFALWASVEAGAPAPVHFLGLVAAFVTPWLFLLAVVQRWELTVSTTGLACRYEADPDSGILELVSRIEAGDGNS